MNFARGLGSVALLSLGAMMLCYKIDPVGMGVLMVLGLAIIWR